MKRPIKKERRKRRILSGIIAVVLVAAMALGMFLNYGTNVQAAPNTVVDPDTTNNWTQFTAPDGQPSTQNVGRIWTDKSVFNGNYEFQNEDSSGLQGQSISKGDNADFLVALSALSSTSNLKSTTVTTTPLDIVLVLDVSGSMDDGMGSSVVYSETYNIRETSSSEGYIGWHETSGGTYYALVDGEYVQLEEELEVVHTSWAPWGSTDYHNHVSWKLNGEVVEPKTSQNDNNPGHIQFYTRGTQSIDKIDALKNAANQFIDSVNELNQGVTNTDDRSRIAIVKYADDSYRYTIGNDRGAGGDSRYNYTQVVSDFTSDADGLKGDINSLRAGGATAADYGLTMAQNVIKGGSYGNGGNRGTYQGARDDAQKIVIFFTDGEPNHSSGWSGSVAATSVNIAHDMKAAGTTIYTIGVVNGANPSQNPENTSNLNKYLHAVSSNYKSATAVDRWGDASWSNLNLGARTQDKDGGNANYYYAASDAAELDQVFEDITSSITQNAGSGSPIVDNSTEGNTDPGKLVFTDQLGSYMQVTDITDEDGNSGMRFAYGDNIYTSTSKSTSGNVDTYHFEGVVGGNAVYGEANLADLTVEVTHSTDLATGDIVKVTIPASLIPMRNYNVDTDNKTMDVSQAYPVRLFYGVSLKDDAEKALSDTTSDEYKAIIESQDTEGTIDFYSNNFVKDQADGETTAVFEPNASNKFYYFTQPAELYLDQACTQPATRSNIEGYSTLYYKDAYWQLTGNGTEAKEITDGYGTVTSGTAEWDAIEWGDRWSDQAQIPAGTQRTSRPGTLTAAKKPNETNTASNVLNPSWSGEDEVTLSLIHI